MEDRLARIEEKIDQSLEFHGTLKQFMKNTDDRLGGVHSKIEKVEGALVTHEKDKDAHGAGVKREMTGSVIGWLTILSGFSGLIGAAAHALIGKATK